MTRLIKCDECGSTAGFGMASTFLKMDEDTDYCLPCVMKMIDGYRKYMVTLRSKVDK